MCSESIAMIQTIEELAEISIARGCGFAALAIATLTVGLSWDMVLAAKTGGLSALLVCAVLAGKAWRALARPVAKTELWLMLQRSDRPRGPCAQHIIGTALRGCYLRCALHAACVSASLLALSVGLQLNLGPAVEVITLR
jgi:hypothetical protein